MTVKHEMTGIAGSLSARGVSERSKGALKAASAGLVLILLGQVPSAEAGVTLKNGNFNVAYRDIAFQGGMDLNIERTYNSKANFRGVFGEGWGAWFEPKLTETGDGSVLIREFGGGAELLFSPAKGGLQVDQAVKELTAAATLHYKMTPAQATTYSDRLRKDFRYRVDEWTKLARLKVIKARENKVGTQFTTTQFNYQFLTRMADGYVRNFENGKVERYDLQGRLSKVTDRAGNFINLAYEGERLKTISDNAGHRLNFTFTAAGLVEKIEGDAGKVAVYRHNAAGQLVYTKDSYGNEYNFKYTTDGRNFITEIGYSDKTSMQIAYFGADKGDGVKTVKDRDGSVTEYEYMRTAADPDHFSVSYRVKSPDEKDLSSRGYEYFLRHRQDGSEWTHKMISTEDGEKTETVYNECCGLPLIIKRGTEETSFEYDTRGRVVRKTTPYDETRLVYDPKAGKVSKVTKFSKASKAQKLVSEFKYDEKANLIFAKNSRGKGVTLAYDSQNRIMSMRDSQKRTINFKYNSLSRPVEITDPALGSIQVTYGKGGEIQKVDSPAGRKIAMQVTAAFQELLDLIRPAGVSLSL